MLPEPFRQSLVERLRELYGERLRDILLFGSYARGQAHADSDIDVMIVLDDPVNKVAESWRLADVRLDLMSEIGASVEFVVVSTEEYAQGRWPLLQNVRREAVSLR